MPYGVVSYVEQSKLCENETGRIRADQDGRDVSFAAATVRNATCDQTLVGKRVLYNIVMGEATDVEVLD